LLFSFQRPGLKPDQHNILAFSTYVVNPILLSIFLH